jgi:cell division protease FtsH
MVTEYGMSSLGPVIYGDKNQEVFLGRDFGHVRNYSEEIAASIDKEIKTFIDNAYHRTQKLVEENKETIERVAKKLMEKENLARKDFIKLFEEESKAIKKTSSKKEKATK